MASQARILVTGFGPFPGILDNASGDFARRLADCANKRLPDAETVAAVLPVEWEAAPRLLRQLLAELQPAICLHLGVSSHAQAPVIETVARNSANPRPDAADRLPACKQLLNEAPPLLRNADPFRLLSAAARAGLPLEVSDGPGGYLCNAIYFHSLWLARKQASASHLWRPVAFMHLPVRIGELGVPEQGKFSSPPMAVDVALGTAICVLSTLLELDRARAVLKVQC